MQKNSRYPGSGWDEISEGLGVAVPARADPIIYDWNELSSDRVYNDAKVDLVVSYILRGRRCRLLKKLQVQDVFESIS